MVCIVEVRVGVQVFTWIEFTFSASVVCVVEVRVGVQVLPDCECQCEGVVCVVEVRVGVQVFTWIESSVTFSAKVWSVLLRLGVGIYGLSRVSLLVRRCGLCC